MEKIIIRKYASADFEVLVGLLAEFRLFLKELQNPSCKQNINQNAARTELENYVSTNYEIFVAKDASAFVKGFFIMEIRDNVIFAHILYVCPEVRRRGIASALYAKAEERSHMNKQETVYNWIHPDNEGIINFLGSRGYDTVNLLELRKQCSFDKHPRHIKVGNHKFFK